MTDVMGDVQQSYDVRLGALDQTGAEDVEIMIRHDGRVVWINEGGICRLRICQIKGRIFIDDQRPHPAPGDTIPSQARLTSTGDTAGSPVVGLTTHDPFIRACIAVIAMVLALWIAFG